MKPHELNRMFNALTPGPEREKTLLEKLLQNDTRRERPVKNWKRIAICVAVATLLMACTVGAVAAIAPFFSKMEVTKESDGVYWLTEGITYYPVDSLSDELKAQDGQGPDFEHIFDSDLPVLESWDRVEEFVGLDLMNNQVLEATGTEIPYSEFNRQLYKGQFRVLTDRDLKQLYIYANYQIGEVSVHVDQDVFTDRMTQEERMHNTLLGYDFSYNQKNGSEIKEETYVAPNGLETLLVMIDDEHGSCLTTVSLNGIRTGITTISPNGVEDARKVMIQVLNGFTP